MNQEILVFILSALAMVLTLFIVILILHYRRLLHKTPRPDRLSLLFEHATDGMLMLDQDGRIRQWNPAMEIITGYTAAEVMGQTIWDIQNLLYLPDDKKKDDRQSLIELLQQGELITRQSILEYSIIRPDGEKRVIQELVFPIRTPQGYSLGSILRDITLWTDQDTSLAEIALKDELTGLYNRRGFLLLGDLRLNRASAAGHFLTLIYVDMDNMKTINDSFGHQEGDAALKALTAVLISTFRDDDIIARIGGDEFVVLAAIQGENQIPLLENRLHQYLENHNNHSDKEYRVEISMGHVTAGPKQSTRLADLLKQADARMYEQKMRKKSSPE